LRIDEAQWIRYADKAVRHLQRLLTIDTTNPPGNESEAARYIYDTLDFPRLERYYLEPEPERGNVIVRRKGEGQKGPLLILSHLDVVPADPKAWTYPPFSGQIADGYIWGRGAVDMKFMAALAITLMEIFEEENITLKRDLIFAGTADEETGGHKGAGWLVKKHPDLLKADFAVTEVGGFTLHLLGKRFVPIQVAQKGFCWVQLTVKGTGGHGSLPLRDNPLFKAAQILERIKKNHLPFHETDVVNTFLSELGEAFPLPIRYLFKSLTVPAISDYILDYLFPDQANAAAILAMTHNTISPTIMKGSEKVNVIPGEVALSLDGRILPGQTRKSFLKEIQTLIGNSAHIEILEGDDPIEFPIDTDFFQMIKDVIKEMDPEAIPLPMMTPAFTDARHLARLPVTTYGFMPMQFPPDVNFNTLLHGIDERVPLSSVLFGLKSLARLIEKANE